MYQNSELKWDADYIDPEANSFDFKSKIYNYRPPFFKQFWYLLQRDLKGIYRNPHASRVQIISIIIIAIMIILIYGKLGNNEQSIQSRTGVTLTNKIYLY